MKKIYISVVLGYFSLISASAIAQELKCPSMDFESFVKSYAGNVPIQKRYTADVIEYEEADFVENKEEKIAKKDIKFYPLMDGKRDWPKNAELSIDHKKGSDTGIATISVPDSGYILNYHFRLRDDCWYLTRYENLVN